MSSFSNTSSGSKMNRLEVLDNLRFAQCRLMPGWRGSKRSDRKEEKPVTRRPTFNSCVLHKSHVSFSIFQTTVGGGSRRDVKKTNNEQTLWLPSSCFSKLLQLELQS